MATKHSHLALSNDPAVAHPPATRPRDTATGGHAAAETKNRAKWCTGRLRRYVRAGGQRFESDPALVSKTFENPCPWARDDATEPGTDERRLARGEHWRVIQKRSSRYA